MGSLIKVGLVGGQISIIGIYIFLYGQLYLVLSGLEKALLVEAKLQNIESLETALASQSFIQLGLLTGLPMVMEIGLEKGFLVAVKDFVLMQLQLAAVFFTFALGTKTHHYGRTILHGGAKYRPTGRKVVVFHTSFAENFRLYSRSHFVKGFELMLLLVVYDLFRRSYESNVAYVLITYSIWFMSITWLFAPFLFNPSGFSWEKIVDDWKGWNKWIRQQGGIGIQQDKSWESWWNDEQCHLRHTGTVSRLFEIFLSLRFFMYQYGLVYHLDISQQSKNFLVYVLSWVVILLVFLIAKVRKKKENWITSRCLRINASFRYCCGCTDGEHWQAEAERKLSASVPAVQSDPLRHRALDHRDSLQGVPTLFDGHDRLFSRLYPHRMGFDHGNIQISPSPWDYYFY